MINVKSWPYRAHGNGIADDTGHIQSAIDAAEQAGGEVYLPPGRYRLTDRLEIADCANVTLRGEGRGLAVLDATGVTQAMGRRILGHGYTNGIIAIGTTDGKPALDHITLRDFSILGPTTTSNSKIINIGATRNCRVSRVLVDGSVNEAIYSDPLAGFGYE
jgi:hypothetical protein